MTIHRFAQVFAVIGVLLWLMRILLDRWDERNRKNEALKLKSDQPLDSLKGHHLNASPDGPRR